MPGYFLSVKKNFRKISVATAFTLLAAFFSVVWADTCTPNAWVRCWSGNVWWYDSCGNRETVYDNCLSTETCKVDECVPETSNENCDSNTYLRCWSGNVWWYDSCGRREKLYKQCAWGEDCSDGQCVKADVSNDSCIGNTYKKCYDGNVYWYDSCGRRGELYEQCGSDNELNKYRCDGDWVQYESNTQRCSNGACSGSTAWGRVENCAASGKVCKKGVCVIADLVPPVIVSLAPAGTVYNQNITLVANTNEAADCRFDSNDVDYESMSSKFLTPNKIYHSVPAVLSDYGDYTYYVRCVDTSGNYDQQSGKISFVYKAPETAPQKKEEADNDHLPPVISGLSPLGDVDTERVTLSCATDGEAICKYDTADTDYDLMRYQMDGQNDGTAHSKEIAPGSSGPYVYYIRCRDLAGNTSNHSARINFNFLATTDPGPRVSGLLPSGTIYQPNIALSAVTDREAECRWSADNVAFDEMAKALLTADGQTQYAIIQVDNFGEYDYYIQCKDNNGGLSRYSSQISFDYEDPNAQVPTEEDKTACDKITFPGKDGACNNSEDCVCDQDCPLTAGGIDPDCAVKKITITRNQAEEKVGMAVTAGLAIIVTTILALVVVHGMAKKPVTDDDDDGLP